MHKMILRTFFILALIALPHFSGAEPLPFDYRPLTLTLSPEYPAAGETVHMKLESYALDLDRSLIRWDINGKTFASGVALKETSVAAGKTGELIEIGVIVTDPQGLVGYADARIQPAEIDILWDTNAYVPPFYKGRALAGTSATVRAYAWTRLVGEDGKPIPEADILYTWSRSGSVLTSLSGRGKSRATFAGPSFGSDTITVEAEAVNGGARTRTSTEIFGTDARLVLYENHPLFGILFHRAIVGDVNTVEDELKVTASPYFARVASPESKALQYEWRVGGASVAADATEPQTLLLAANGYRGPIAVDLSLTNSADFLMRASASWRLIFGETGSSLFGGGSIFGE